MHRTWLQGCRCWRRVQTGPPPWQLTRPGGGFASSRSPCCRNVAALNPQQHPQLPGQEPLPSCMNMAAHTCCALQPALAAGEAASDEQQRRVRLIDFTSLCNGLNRSLCCRRPGSAAPRFAAGRGRSCAGHRHDARSTHGTARPLQLHCRPPAVQRRHLNRPLRRWRGRPAAASSGDVTRFVTQVTSAAAVFPAEERYVLDVISNVLVAAQSLKIVCQSRHQPAARTPCSAAWRLCTCLTDLPRPRQCCARSSGGK